MISLNKFITFNHILRNCSSSKKLFASASILADKKDTKQVVDEKKKFEAKNSTVAAVFASLNEADLSENQSPLSDQQNTGKQESSKVNLDQVIMNAKTVNGLLSIAENNNNSGSISRKHALKIVSILAEWSSINKVNLNEFENDARFTKLCRILGRSVPNTAASSATSSTGKIDVNLGRPTKRVNGFRTEDLNTVLGVTGDDEAAKLVSSITLPQMVKVLVNLAQRKRRSTPLLRSLAYNIASKDEELDLKQCASVLYAMSTLHFPDSVLTTKICADVQAGLKQKIEKSSAIGSILTSLSLLKHHDAVILDFITEWTLNNSDICRTQDIAALFLTLANLNYLPEDHVEAIKSKLITSLTTLDFKRDSEYLSFVWSLMSLDLVTEDHLKYVLSDHFIQSLSNEKDGVLSPTIKMKLLNINAGSKLLLKNKYDGLLLTTEKNPSIFECPIAHNKDKQSLVLGMADALKSLIPENYLTINKDSQMGFLIDAEFVMDDKCNPLPKESSGGKRVAVMVHDYHDMCQGAHQKLNGISALALKLLQKSDYSIISVPYSEFSNSDKLLKRIQYLERKIKEISNRKN